MHGSTSAAWVNKYKECNNSLSEMAGLTSTELLNDSLCGLYTGLGWFDQGLIFWRRMIVIGIEWLRLVDETSRAWHIKTLISAAEPLKLFHSIGLVGGDYGEAATADELKVGVFIENLTHYYGSGEPVTALKELTFDIESWKLVCTFENL